MRDGQPVYRIAEIAEIDKSPRGLYKVGPIETDVRHPFFLFVFVLFCFC